MNAREGTKKILVVRVGALGDTLMATPVVRALKEQGSAVSVDFLCSELAAALLELNENIGQLHRLRWRNVPFVVSTEKRALVRRLRDRAYSTAILLESAPRYRNLLVKAGITDVRDFGTVPFDPELHSIVNNLRVAGFTRQEPSMLAMDLPLSEKDRRDAERLLSGLCRPRVGLHAGYGPSSRKRDQGNRLKGWSVSRFRRLGQLLLDEGATLVLTGSRQDLALTRALASAWPVERFRNLAGLTTVRRLAAAIEQLDLLISVDSGPAHMAAALGTPLIVLWGPAKFQQVGPIGTRGRRVEIVRNPVPCAPCYDTPAMKSCRRNICMQGISPEEVARKARRILSGELGSG